ncbi:MAG: ABC transporter ATP-binding protein [Alphaproteobacteria bacterium]|nr:ABC transporter ATP-binding protein [Alphaproteobacteria bacterium]
MTDNSTILEINNLKKSYGHIEVLKDISIDMQQGEFLVLLGPSGCGKSTLLNCIAGLEEIDSGDVKIGSETMNDVPPKERNVAMVFQSYALYPTMTVRENITFGMKIRGDSAAEMAAEIERVAAMLQINPLLDRKPAELSGGQRQRVAMGRALVRKPKLFLFDEPLSNLDAKLRVEMRAEIKDLHETVGASIVYVTHDQIEAMTLADKICVLNVGVIQQIGSPDEVYHQPANIFVAEFMGFPAMNMIDATHISAEFARTVEGVTLVGVRPEDMVVVANWSENCIEVEIVSIENTGPDAFASVKFGDEKLIIRLNARSGHKNGDVLNVDLEQSIKHYFDSDGNRVV